MKHKMGKKIAKGKHKYPNKTWKDVKLSNNHGNIIKATRNYFFIVSHWRIFKHPSIPSVGKDGERVRA